MRKNELVLIIYRMDNRRGCLLLIVKGKKPLKILNLLKPLRFVAWMKQLSKAIDTGAEQECAYELECLYDKDRLLKCCYTKQIVSIELCFKRQNRLRWQGTAREFGAAVDDMIASLPGFFK